MKNSTNEITSKNDIIDYFQNGWQKSKSTKHWS